MNWKTIGLYVGEPWRPTLEGQDYPGLGTGDLSSAIIEIEWDAAAVAPAVSGKVYVDAGVNRSAFALPIRKLRHLNFTPAAAGLFQLDKIDQGPDLFYTRRQAAMRATSARFPSSMR